MKKLAFWSVLGALVLGSAGFLSTSAWAACAKDGACKECCCSKEGCCKNEKKDKSLCCGDEGCGKKDSDGKCDKKETK